jgi:CBS-domain-containing membrane protein
MSPLAQPELNGSVISAIVGVTVAQLAPDIMWLTAALSVFDIRDPMQLTVSTRQTTALISGILHKLRWVNNWYVLEL